MASSGAATPAASGAVDDGSSVKVAVRVRPLIPKEVMSKCGECVRVASSQQICIGANKSFTFDNVFGQHAQQEDIFRHCVRPLLHSFLEGYNATVFAYGQTGSGKTHTMGSASSVLDGGVATPAHTSSSSSSSSRTHNTTSSRCGGDGGAADSLGPLVGIIPRVIEGLFCEVQARQGQAEFLIRVSYLEIYQEELRDLLEPATPSKDIHIREDSEGGIMVHNVKEEVVRNSSDMYQCLQRGALSRTTAATLMNEKSSRSHSIFTIILEQRLGTEESNAGGAASGGDYLLSKFHLVDLAGSERNKKTGAVGARFKESVTINSGLLALSKVISALSGAEKRGTGATAQPPVSMQSPLQVPPKEQHVHVPYRESKLTRMLQDSLGGNSRTLMVACVSPADVNFEETLNTLHYANRAKNIKNKPVVNRDPHTAQLMQLKSQIEILQVELLKHRVGRHDGEYTLEDLLQDDTNRRYLEDLQKMMVQTTGDRMKLGSRPGGAPGTTNAMDSGSRNPLAAQREELLKSENEDLQAELEGLRERHTYMLEEFERAVQDCKQYHRRTIQTHRALQNICESLQEVENADEIVQVSTNCLEEIANKLKSLASQHPPKYADVSTLQKRSDAPSSPFHGLPSEGNSPRLPQAGSIGKSDKPPLLGLQRSSSASLSINGKKLVSQLEAELEKVRKELRMTRRQLMLCKSGAENEVGNGSVVEDKDALRGGGGSEPEEGGDVEGEEESVSAQLLEARKQVFDMEEELKVAQEHLRLDEQIFEEKTTELAKLKNKHRSNVEKYEAANSELAEAKTYIQMLEEHVDKLQLQIWDAEERSHTSSSVLGTPNRSPLQNPPPAQVARGFSTPNLIRSVSNVVQQQRKAASPPPPPRSAGSPLRDSRKSPGRRPATGGRSPVRSPVPSASGNRSPLRRRASPERRAAPAAAGAEMEDLAGTTTLAGGGSPEIPPVPFSPPTGEGLEGALGEAESDIMEMSTSPNLSELESQRLALEQQRADLRAHREQLVSQQELEKEHSAHNEEIERAFLEQKGFLEGELDRLTAEIQERETLIQDLVQKDERTKMEIREYEIRIVEMEREVEEARIALQKLGQADEALMEKERLRMQRQYESKLRAKEQELEDLRQRQKEHERLLKAKAESDRRLRTYENELLRMRQQQELLRRRMKEEITKHEDMKENANRELVKKKREVDSAQRKIRNLEAENERQREMLTRKQNEIASTRMKLREQRAAGTVVRQQKVQALDRQKAWLDREVEKYLQNKDAIEKLELEVKRREKIVQQKEDLLSKKTELEQKRERSAAAAAAAAAASMSRRSVSLNEGILPSALGEEEKLISGEGTSLPPPADRVDQHKQEVDKLLSARDDMIQFRDTVAEQQEQPMTDAGDGWTGEEEEALQDIDEYLEILTAEIDYKNDSIQQLQEQLNEGRSRFFCVVL